MEKIYKKIGWKNKPNLSTPLGATNLKKIDEALDGLDNRTIELDTQRVNHKRLIDGLYVETDALKKEIEEVSDLDKKVDDLTDLSNIVTQQVTLLDGRVTEAESDITENAENITILENRFTGFSVAMSQGMEHLYDRVIETENSITKNTEDINALKIVPTASGSPVYIFDASNMGLEGIDTFGESKQNGSPTPTSPIPIESKIVNRVDVSGKQFLDATSFKTTTGDISSVLGNGYEITSKGGLNNAYSFSYKELKNVDLLKGKTIYFIADSIVGTVANANSCVQLRVTLSDGSNQYYGLYSPSLMSRAIEIPNNATAIQFGLYSNNSGVKLTSENTVTAKGVRIVLSSDAPWEEYKGFQTVNLSAPIELNGIGGVRDTIEIYADGSGKHIQRVGKMYTRTAPAIYTSSLTNPNGNVYILTVSSWEKEILWTHRNKGQSVSTLTKDQYYVGQNESVASSKVIYFISSATTTASALAEIQAENSEIYYILLNPIETALPQVDIDAIKNLHTYKPNTVAMNDADAEMDVHYVADARLYIDQKFETLAKAIVNQ